MAHPFKSRGAQRTRGGGDYTDEGSDIKELRWEGVRLQKGLRVLSVARSVPSTQKKNGIAFFFFIQGRRGEYIGLLRVSKAPVEH